MTDPARGPLTAQEIADSIFENEDTIEDFAFAAFHEEGLPLEDGPVKDALYLVYVAVNNVLNLLPEPLDAEDYAATGEEA